MIGIVVKHIGILIRTPQEHRPCYFIIDKDNGKFSAFTSRSNISRGSLLSYSMNQQRNKTYIHAIDILDLPDIKNENDLLFFHQVLELIYYFLPLGKVAPDIFYILLSLYTSLEQLNTSGLKKLFLFKLFTHLGYYPECSVNYFPILSMIRTEDINVTIHRQVDLSLERKLDRWLDYCVSLHPCTKYFKTISNFISRKP